VPIDQAERQVTISFDVAAQRRNPPVGEVAENQEGYNCCDIISRNILKDLNQSIGILCLSKVGDSILMWSHYADQYAGAAIEFDGSADFFNGQIDIEYRSDRPKRDISAYLNAGVPVPLAELCVKSDQWQYEEEVRIIRNLTDCVNTGNSRRGFPVYTQRVPQDCIRQIVLGERTSVDDQRKVWEAIKATDIGLSLAAIANWGYEFRKEPVKLGSNPVITPRTAHIFSHLPNALGEIARLQIEKHPLSKFVNTIA
jgi:hypothetical protein